MRGRRAVILGASGLIGSEVAKKLQLLGEDVVAVDGRRTQNFLSEHIPWFYGSIDDPNLLNEAIQPGDDIFHFAESSFPGHPQEWKEGLNALERLEKLCRFAQERDCRIIYPSSGGTVYGRTSIIPIPEDHPLAPVSHYGLLKKMSEQVLLYHKRTRSLRCFILRISNCYGPSFRSEKKQGIVGVAASAILSGKPVRLVGEGKQVRDFVHARDVAEFCASVHLSDLDGQTINVGSGTGLSMTDVVKTVAAELNKKPVIILLPSRSFDVENNVLDPTKALRLLGWTANTTFEEGVREICAELMKRRTIEKE